MEILPRDTLPKNHLDPYRGPGCSKKSKLLYHRLHFCMCIRPELIIGCAWKWNPFVWLIYRCFIAMLTTVLLVFLLASHVAFHDQLSNTLKFFIYLTNWSFILLTVTAITWSGILTTRYYAKHQPPETSNDLPQEKAEVVPWPFIVLWIFININTTCALSVTLGYWLAVYKPGITVIYPSTVFSHIVNSVLVLTDVMLSSTPFRLAHFYQPLAFGIFYMIFTLAYYAQGGTDTDGRVAIYSTLDWDNPLSTLQISFLGGVFVVLVLHSLVCFLSLVRCCIVTCCLYRGSRSVDAPC